MSSLFVVLCSAVFGLSALSSRAGLHLVSTSLPLVPSPFARRLQLKEAAAEVEPCDEELASNTFASSGSLRDLNSVSLSPKSLHWLLETLPRPPDGQVFGATIRLPGRKTHGLVIDVVMLLKLT